jgi:hypothetical protein
MVLYYTNLQQAGYETMGESPDMSVGDGETCNKSVTSRPQTVAA